MLNEFIMECRHNDEHDLTDEERETYKEERLNKNQKELLLYECVDEEDIHYCRNFEFINQCTFDVPMIPGIYDYYLILLDYVPIGYLYTRYHPKCKNRPSYSDVRAINLALCKDDLLVIEKLAQKLRTLPGNRIYVDVIWNQYNLRNELKKEKYADRLEVTFFEGLH